MIDTLAVALGILVIGVPYYNQIRRLTDLIDRQSNLSQAYRILRWVQWCSIITFFISIQALEIEPLLGIDWQDLRFVLGIFGLIWLIEPLRNMFDLDLSLKAVGGRLCFWGVIRVLLLSFVPWSVIGIIFFDYAIVKQLQLRIQHHALFTGRQLTNQDLKQHAITLGKDGVMIAEVDSDQNSKVEIHL